LISFIQGVIPSVDSAITATGALISGLGAATNLTPVTDLVAQTLNKVTGLASLLTTLLGLGRRKRLLLGGGSDATGALKAALQAVTTAAGSLTAIVGGLATDITSQTLTDLKTALNAKLAEIQALLSSTTGAINLSTVNGLVQDVIKLENDIIKELSNTQGSVNDLLGDLIDGVEGVAGKLNDAVGQIADLNLSGVTQNIVSSLQGIIGDVGNTLDKVQSIVSGVDTEVQKITTTLVTSTQAVVSKFDTLITNTIKQVACS